MVQPHNHVKTISLANLCFFCKALRGSKILRTQFLHQARPPRCVCEPFLNEKEKQRHGSILKVMPKTPPRGGYSDIGVGTPTAYMHEQQQQK